MRKVLGALALLSAGMLAATQPSLAQTTQADIPANPAGPILDGTAGNSGLILSVWSPSLPLSLIYYTGLNYDQVQRPDITPEAGLTLDFGVIPQWDALSAATDLVYHLVAVDGQGTAATKEILTTAGLGLAGFSANNGDVNSISGSSAFANVVGQVNGQPSCGAVTPCLAVDAQQTAWDTNLGGYLDVSAAGAVGTALGFYSIVGGTPAANTQTLAVVSRFENSSGFGTWLLSQAGQLTYTIAGAQTVVPLPAAVWLLLSGLAGFGVVSRRRNVA
jgi:hypothetical protein